MLICPLRVTPYVQAYEEILPGYEIVVDWFDDAWSPYLMANIVTQQFHKHPARYVGIMQGSDPGAAMISRMAYTQSLPHFGYHIAASMSDRELAPAYFRTMLQSTDISPAVVALLQDIGWRTLGVVYDPVQFILESQIFKERYMASSNFTLSFFQGMGDYGPDRQKVIFLHMGVGGD